MRLMAEFKPDIVFHAAALKHVPILERDWSEGVKTNIFGSVNVADAALAAGAKAMVMISTDKAIEPVSMLGLTKRFAEMYCQALDHDLAAQSGGKPRMRLISVRFGNVLASNGSVVPKFKAQIEAGGPVTVTHPDMVRYFMTIREACDLVLTAATHALTPARGDVSVYVLNMGQPVKIVDLAERMIRLSGLQPGHDIEIVFTGMRPGERLNEILFATEEPAVEIGVAGIMAAKPNEPPMQTLRKWIAALEQAIAQRRPDHHQGHSEGCGPGIRFDRRVIRRGHAESIDAAARKNRRRQPALPAGSQHDRRHHGGDRRPSGVGSAGAGAFGDAGLGQSGSDRFRPAGGCRDQEPDAGEGRADQARDRRNVFHDAGVRGAAGRLRRAMSCSPSPRRLCCPMRWLPRPS